MTLGGFPIYTFAPLALGVALSLVMVWQLGVLARQLAIDPNNPGDGKRLSAAIYSGETRLHDLGVHRSVWIIRLAFIVETVCILLFAYLLMRAMEVI